MSELPYSLERTVVIRADPASVFRYFEDSSRWANWWGAGSTIDPKPGGNVYIRYPNGIEAAGEVLEISPPRKIVFTFGYKSGNPIPVGSSRVTIQVGPGPDGTKLQLLHEFAAGTARDQHVQGWRFQLSMFSNVVSNEVHADSATRIDAWFEAWTIADDDQRRAIFAAISAPGIQFRDRHSLLSGIDDLNAHAGVAIRYQPGAVLRRNGDVRQCQGMALADWTVTGPDGQERLSGTSVFVFGSDGKIQSAAGFANPAA
jgi:uncharacterized protein YndB with AHSA1/START domain